MRRVMYTASIVGAYVSKNPQRADELPQFIEKVFTTLNSLSSAAASQQEAAVLTPAVPVKKSIQPDYLVCLEDGRKFRSLKRHLARVYDLTPEQYREKWNLPRDYPMVAPNYSEVRSRLAKAIGLGLQVAGTRPPKGMTSKPSGQKAPARAKSSA